MHVDAKCTHAMQNAQGHTYLNAIDKYIHAKTQISMQLMNATDECNPHMQVDAKCTLARGCKMHKAWPYISKCINAKTQISMQLMNATECNSRIQESDKMHKATHL